MRHLPAFAPDIAKVAIRTKLTPRCPEEDHLIVPDGIVSFVLRRNRYRRKVARKPQGRDPKEVLMPLKDSSVPEVRTLMTGLMFGESPRWHDGRFWVSDWVAHELIAVDLEGKSEVVVREPSVPLCFDFLPDEPLLIMSGRRVLRLEPDGSRATHADLTGLSEVGWNEIVVDGRANAYVNTAGFDLMAGADFVPGAIAVVTADVPVLTVLSISEDDRVGDDLGKLATRYESAHLRIPNE
jgi:hypothetical protein